MKKYLALLLLIVGTATSAKAQYVNRTNLPAIYVETFDGKGITSKEEYKYCRMHYVDEDGGVTSYDSVSIRGRGNSTWSLSKKPFKIKFKEKERFLGKGYAKAKKWTLLANAGDKTMMRNALTSSLGRFCASVHYDGVSPSLPFNPAARFVDLVLNNSYLGTYQVSDHVDVRPHRVDIDEQAVPPDDGDDISGGYLLEVDGFRDGNSFTTSTYRESVRIHYPDDEDIAPRQNTYIRSQVNQFERALSSATFTDPATGYRPYVDASSLFDWYICTEVSANVDGFFSTYFYKQRGDQRFFWGPLWDYDIAYDNDYRVSTEEGLESSVHSLMADIGYHGSKVWVNRMWDDPWFQQNVNTRYRQLLGAGLVAFMQQTVDSLQELLQQSQQLNYERWGINRRMYHETVLYSSYEQYVDDLKAFITDHCAYLSKAFAEKGPADPTPPFSPARCYYHLLNAGTMKAIGISGHSVVQQANNAGSESQDWYVRPLGSGEAFMIVNRTARMALTDPTEGDTGPTVNTGTPLTLDTPDEDNPRQQWQLLPQGTAGCYNLLNVHTHHVANLKGGSHDDGTPVISFTNDDRNSESPNRLWLPIPGAGLTDGINTPDTCEPAEYALAYDPATKTLHFGSETPEALTFTAHVYTASGQPVGSFRADEPFSMNSLPAGTYIVSWSVGGKTRTGRRLKIKN